MTTENELVCPVCRAKQAYQIECRRCGADLSLWVKALRSLHVAQQRVVEVAKVDELKKTRALNYLHWLSPKAAHSIKHKQFSAITNTNPLPPAFATDQSS